MIGISLGVIQVAAVSAAPAPPKADGAAFGPYYDLGTWNWTAFGSPLTVQRFGDEFQLDVARGGATTTGPRGWLDWDDCPRGGSVIEQVRLSMTRTAESTSPLFAFRVTDRAATVYATSENFRDGLAGAIAPTRRPYVIGTSNCAVQLRIDQAIAGSWANPQRYWITSPRALVRDVQSPQVALGALPTGWRSIDTLPVTWGATDNFDGSGVGNHHIQIDGVDRWAGGYFRQVNVPFGAEVGLADVPDGSHTVSVVVDGDGTEPGIASGTIYLDRRPPNANISAAKLAPGRVRVALDGQDPSPGAGLASWFVALGDTTVASSANSAPLENLDLSRFDGTDVVLRFHTTDAAGNSAAGSSAPIRIDTTPPQVALSGLGDGWVSAA
jgi:hypothetical protein